MFKMMNSASKLQIYPFKQIKSLKYPSKISPGQRKKQSNLRINTVELIKSRAN